MPSRKPLKSVARSVADSFTSLMNYFDNGYVLDHLVEAAHTSRKTKLEVDLLRSTAGPPELLTEPVRKSVEYYCAGFSELVERSGSDPSMVTSATLTVEIQLDGPQALPRSRTRVDCTTTIVDDRGKAYETVLTQAW